MVNSDFNTELTNYKNNRFVSENEYNNLVAELYKEINSNSIELILNNIKQR